MRSPEISRDRSVNIRKISLIFWMTSGRTVPGLRKRVLPTRTTTVHATGSTSRIERELTALFVRWKGRGCVGELGADKERHLFSVAVQLQFWLLLAASLCFSSLCVFLLLILCVVGRKYSR